MPCISPLLPCAPRCTSPSTPQYLMEAALEAMTLAGSRSHAKLNGHANGHANGGGSGGALANGNGVAEDADEDLAAQIVSRADSSLLHGADGAVYSEFWPGPLAEGLCSAAFAVCVRACADQQRHDARPAQHRLAADGHQHHGQVLHGARPHAPRHVRSTELCAHLRRDALPRRLVAASRHRSHTPACPPSHCTAQVSSQVHLPGLAKDALVPHGLNGAMANGLANGSYSSSQSFNQYGAVRGTPYLSKLESIASSAVRAADKVCARGGGAAARRATDCVVARWPSARWTGCAVAR